MLRSELTPRTCWIDSARWALFFVALGIVGTIGFAAIVVRLPSGDHKRAQDRAEASRTGASGANMDIVTTTLPPTPITVLPPLSDQDTMTVVGLPGNGYRHLVIKNGYQGRDLLHIQDNDTDHAITNIGIEVIEASADNTVKNEEVGRTETAPSNATWCATKCASGVDCYALWIEDKTNHVRLTLPCKDGKVGTWEMTKLP